MKCCLEAHVRSAPRYAVAIAALARAGDWQSALDLLFQMVKSELDPDTWHILHFKDFEPASILSAPRVCAGSFEIRSLTAASQLLFWF